MDFFEQSNGWNQHLPSHIYEGDSQSPPLQKVNQIESETKCMQTNLKKREHTAPKVLLSILHKILYWDTTTTKKFKELLCVINKKHNNSTPIKFLLLASKADLTIKLKSKFPGESQQKLAQIKVENEWSQERIRMAKHWRQIIIKAINQKDWKKQVDLFWHDSKQQRKYQKCFKDIQEFKDQIKSLKREKLRKQTKKKQNEYKQKMK